MAQELELKLSLPPEQHDNFRDLELFAGGVATTKTLFNAYYDTPDRQLQQAKIALRIRQQEDLYIQTLKTSGTSDGGLHNRQEWEWSLSQPTLDIAAIREVMPNIDIDWSQLDTLFETDFVRTAWVLETLNSSIEIVLDHGEVRKDNNIDPISEVELELKNGDPAELFTIAQMLADAVPLRISKISKAERGYRLIDHDSSAPEIKLPRNATPLACVSAIQQWIEWYEYKADAIPEEQFVTQLCELLAQLKADMPAPLTLSFNTVIDDTTASLQKLEQPTALKQCLWDPAFCQMLLQVSGYLYQTPALNSTAH